MTELHGIAWDHSRAFPPLVAATQRYEEHHPEARVRWDKRSLHEFGHMPIDQLADRFDLIVIDHPWAAFCFNRGLVHDLRPRLSDAEYRDFEANAVGPAFESYCYEGSLLALPIDAAAPAPSWRPDLLERHGRDAPATLDDAIALADEGLAVMPAFAPDLFLNWAMLLHALDARPFHGAETIADEAPALEAMDLLRRLAEGMPPAIFDWNPIRIAEHMTRENDVAYCAFAYSYGNYCRPHFAPRPLRYGNLPTLADGTPLRSIVGGTGLAVTRRCADVDAALDFAKHCAGAPVQSGIYTYAGGQPARREAWLDPELDRFNGGFFSGARQAHESAILRPRYDGYVPLQETAGAALQAHVRGTETRSAAWARINERYRDSLS